MWTSNEPASVLSSTPGISSIAASAAAWIASGKPASVSWSVRARTLRPRRAASAISMVGPSVPSENVLCVWRSTEWSASLAGMVSVMSLLAWLDHEPDRRPVFVVDNDVDECRQANRLDAGFTQVIARDCNGLYGLVCGACTDRLHLGA